MADTLVDSPKSHETFLASRREHVLMITNHGVHQWQVIPGLPDTGGQNVFVNRFTDDLARLGFKVTIVNRGGYPLLTTGHLKEVCATKTSINVSCIWKTVIRSLSAKRIWTCKFPPVNR